jgi:FdhD protein
MNSKYKVLKLKSKKQENIDDDISIEEPLEMILKYKKNNNWVNENISITMRTPGNDEDLVIGFLFNEKIIENFNQIEKIEKEGEEVGKYNLQNKIVATINSSENIDIG